MINGCPECEKLSFNELCQECEKLSFNIERADFDVCRTMNLLERLQRKKQKLEQELKQKGTQCQQ